MYSSEKIILTDPRGNSYSLSNRFKNIVKLKDGVEDAKTAKELNGIVNKVSDWGAWEIYKDSNDVTVLKSVDKLGNVSYLKVFKVNGGKSVYSKVRLTNPSNVNMALSNSFRDEVDLIEDIKDCKNIKDLIKVVNKNEKYKKEWSLDRETSNKVRLVSKDKLGNISYLELVKESADMNESFDNVRIPDLSNQPMTPSGVGGGMPTRWVWAEYGKFLNAYGIRNGFNITFNLDSAYDIKQKMAYLYQKRDDGLIADEDLQELEERLRTLSDFVIGGNDNQSGAAIEEIEYDDMANESVSEGRPLSSKYVVAITLYDKSKMNNQSFVPWSFLSLEDDGNRTNDGKPWVQGAFGNCVIKVQKGVNGAKGLYLATKKDINALKKFKSQEDVIDYIEKNCAEVDTKKVNYDKIFDIKVDEEVKPTTSEKQLQHLREIQPLTQTDEAKAKRAKTIKEKKARKLLNVIDEDDLKN